MYNKNCIKSIIIWKISNNQLTCISNNINIQDNILLENYIQLNHIDYGEYYDILIKTKKTQIIKKEAFDIILEIIDENFIIEKHLTKECNFYLLSTISHKIRNPLTNILGLLSLINDSKLNKINKTYLNILKNSTYDIIGIANDIVDIINMNKDRIILNHKKINIEKLLTECKNIYTNELKEKNINIKIVIDDDIPRIFIVDVDRLKQIIANLLNNATYYTSNGGIDVRISLFHENDTSSCPFIYQNCNPPKYNILFKIKDTGTGIDDETKLYIENIFKIKETHMDKPYKSTGFGLFISNYLCNLFYGNMWFKSEVDIGSVFYFNIICDCLNFF